LMQIKRGVGRAGSLSDINWIGCKTLARPHFYAFRRRWNSRGWKRGTAVLAQRIFRLDSFESQRLQAAGSS